MAEMFSTSIAPIVRIILPIKNANIIHKIVLKWPHQLSAIMAPNIGARYASNSLVWKIAVDESGSKFNFRFKYRARIAGKLIEVKS